MPGASPRAHQAAKRLRPLWDHSICAALDRYEAQTRKSKVAICREVRGELVQRFRDRVAAQTLIQSNARLYLSSKLPKFIKESGRTIRAFDNVFKVLKRSFEQRQQFFDLLLKSYGGSVEPLGDKWAKTEVDAAQTQLNTLNTYENTVLQVARFGNPAAL